MSDTSTCGGRGERVSASCADENVLYAMPSRASAFSSTQRIERSSSTIQTGFMQSGGSRIVNTVRPGADSNSMTPWCLDEGLREREAEAGAAFAPGHQRIEDPLAGAHPARPGPLSIDLQFECQPVALPARWSTLRAIGARAERDRAGAAPAPRCARYSAPPG